MFLNIYFWLPRVTVAACRIFPHGIRALELGLSSCPTVCGILVPQPGMEPVSPALAGGFLATGPPGEVSNAVFFLFILQVTVVAYVVYGCKIFGPEVYLFLWFFWTRHQGNTGTIHPKHGLLWFVIILTYQRLQLIRNEINFLTTKDN